MTNSKLHDVIPNSLVIWITILAAFFMVPLFENLWAARDWTFGVFLFLAILDMVVIIIVLVLIYRIFKRKMEELPIVVITIILSVSLTSLFGDKIIKVLIQDFLLGIMLLIALLPLVVLYVFIYYRGFGWMIRPKKARIRKAKTHNLLSKKMVNKFYGIYMKLFKRTQWKPKQKLCKEDLPFLLAEYRISRNISLIAISFCISMIAIVVAAFAYSLTNPDPNLEGIMIIGLVGFLIFLSNAYNFNQRAKQIAEVLEIEKRLKRYGIA